MALYIMIRKITDNPTSVEYTFGTGEGRPGQLKIDQGTGNVVLVEPAPDDDKGVLYQRATYHIQGKKHWAAGELPEVTCWAS
ncbi:MAG TPA: hypothetical protein VIH59_24790 [Candidatus Tectomicrobia bacterium]|jgi:hypothetical protein